MFHQARVTEQMRRAKINNTGSYHKKCFLILIFMLIPALWPVNLNAQVVTNLQILTNFVDSSLTASNELLKFSAKKLPLQLILPQQASFLESSIRQKFSGLSQPGRINASIDSGKILYTLLEVRLTYPELFRDGFLGPYYLTRQADFKGTMDKITPVGDDSFRFNFSMLDTVKLTLRDSIEMAGFPLTQPSLPAEPFFISIIEPVAVVASLGVTVYLLFNTRKGN